MVNLILLMCYNIKVSVWFEMCPSVIISMNLLHTRFYIVHSQCLWEEIKREILVHRLPTEVSDLWTEWRIQWVPQSVRNFYVMAIVWLIWQERTARIFLQKFKTNHAALESVYYFVAFWLEILPQKKWRTFVRRKGPKGRAGQQAGGGSQQDVDDEEGLPANPGEVLDGETSVRAAQARE